MFTFWTVTIPLPTTEKCFYFSNRVKALNFRKEHLQEKASHTTKTIITTKNIFMNNSLCDIPIQDLYITVGELFIKHINTVFENRDKNKKEAKNDIEVDMDAYFA